VAVQPIPPGIKRLLGSVSANTFAASILATAIALQVFELTGSEFYLGLIGIMQFLPLMALSPFTGTMADRYDRRHVYQAGLGIAMLATVGLLIYASVADRSPVPILCLVALLGIARSVSMPASRSLPIDMAPEGMVERVVAVRSLTFQIALVAGPLAGAFANRVSHLLPFALALLAQVVALLTMRSVPATTTAKLASTPGARETLRDAWNGLKFIRNNPIVFGAISLDLFAVLFGGAVALLPAIVEKRLNIDDVDVGVGVLQAGIAAGAALTALVLSLKPVSRHAGPWLFAVISVFGVATIVLGLTRSYAVAFAAAVVLSAADQVSVFVRASVVPLATPESMRGRVTAVENVFIGGSNQLGAFESGLTARWFGLAPAVVIGGVATLVVVAAGWKLLPELRSVDRFEEVRPR